MSWSRWLTSLNMKSLFARCCLFSLLTERGGAFIINSQRRSLAYRCSHRENQRGGVGVGQVNENDLDAESDIIVEQSVLTRRNFAQIATFVAGIVTWPASSTLAAAEDAPICVIGANGRTGTRCVEACIQRGIPVVATSRLGVYNNIDDMEENKELIKPMVCDVTVPGTIESAVAGSRAVIFAASASKEGGKPSQVDNNGLVNVAKAAMAADVPHLVIVSSGGVSKPDSSVYKFLNIFGNIMAEKIQGEDTIRDMYKSSQKLTYTIVRPGGLTEEPAIGVSFLELNQGDNKSGRISRADVANICIEVTNYPELTGKVTFECYNADTGKSLNAVGLSNILKQTSTTPDVVSGNERRGASWQALFASLQQD